MPAIHCQCGKAVTASPAGLFSICWNCGRLLPFTVKVLDVRPRRPVKRVRRPVGGNNRLRGAKVFLLYECWLAGMSTRKAADFVRVSKVTAMRYFADFNKVLGKRVCLCGELAGHRGWCRKRYLESPGRRAFIAGWKSGCHQ